MGKDADPAAEKSGYAPEAARRAHAQGGRRREGGQAEASSWREDRSSRIRRACPLAQDSLRSPVPPYTAHSHLSLLQGNLGLIQSSNGYIYVYPIHTPSPGRSSPPTRNPSSSRSSPASSESSRPPCSSRSSHRHAQRTKRAACWIAFSWKP